MNDRDHESMLEPDEIPHETSTRRDRHDQFLIQSPQSDLENDKMKPLTKKDHMKLSRSQNDINDSQFGEDIQLEDRAKKKIKQSQTGTLQRMHHISGPREVMNAAVNRSWKNLLAETDDENMAQVQRKGSVDDVYYPSNKYSKNDIKEKQEHHDDNSRYSLKFAQKVPYYRSLLEEPEEEGYEFRGKNIRSNSQSQSSKLYFVPLMPRNNPKFASSQKSKPVILTSLNKDRGVPTVSIKRIQTIQKANKFEKNQMNDPETKVNDESPKEVPKESLLNGKRKQKIIKFNNLRQHQKGVFRQYIADREKRKRDEDIEIYERYLLSVTNSL